MLSCCTLKEDQIFLCTFFMILSHFNFSFHLDSHGGSGYSIVITSPAWGPVQSSDVFVNCLKEINGTTPLRGRWISFQLVVIPGLLGFHAKGQHKLDRKDRTMIQRDISPWICLLSTSS